MCKLYNKPCLESCPIEAIYVDPNDGFTKIKSTSFGCVLCRNACPYDAIHMDVNMQNQLRETFQISTQNYVNPAGHVLQACKTGFN